MGIQTNVGVFRREGFCGVGFFGIKGGGREGEFVRWNGEGRDAVLGETKPGALFV